MDGLMDGLLLLGWRDSGRDYGRDSRVEGWTYAFMDGFRVCFIYYCSLEDSSNYYRQNPQRAHSAYTSCITYVYSIGSDGWDGSTST
jgi:hypothetical protein